MLFEGTNNCNAPQKNLQRETLQLLFDRSFDNKDKSAIREQYKTLRQLELNTSIDFHKETVNISELAESITIASDIIVAETGISFLYCGNETAPAVCNRRFFTKSLLNLLSNAYLYGRSNLVTVKTVETENNIKVEVQNSGRFLNSQNGKGLEFVQKVCTFSNGRFLIEQSTAETRAIMIFKKSNEYVTDSTVDFYSLLNDRLSPVYVEFFGMEQN